jgi:hypothetical protein
MTSLAAGYDLLRMPIDYTIRDGLLSARASGALDDKTLIAYVQIVLADPAYLTAGGDLFDALAVTDVQLTAEGIRTVARLIRHSGRSSAKVAVVAERPAMFGMARMFEMLRNDIEVVVFRDSQTALEWLRARPEAEAPADR